LDACRVGVCWFGLSEFRDTLPWLDMDCLRIWIHAIVCPVTRFPPLGAGSRVSATRNRVTNYPTSALSGSGSRSRYKVSQMQALACNLTTQSLAGSFGYSRSFARLLAGCEATRGYPQLGTGYPTRNARANGPLNLIINIFESFD
jgi:hypothetical protein